MRYSRGMDRAQVTDFIASLEAAAYRRGRRGALDEVTRFIAKLLEEPAADQPGLPLGDAPERAPQPPKMRQNSDQFRVYLTISGKPGIRGVEIVERLNSVGKPIKERTMRTALHRLRAQGLIKLEGAGWHPTGVRPEVTSEGQTGGPV
jgi:hypothetical protein